MYLPPLLKDGIVSGNLLWIFTYLVAKIIALSIEGLEMVCKHCKFYFIFLYSIKPKVKMQNEIKLFL